MVIEHITKYLLTNALENYGEPILYGHLQATAKNWTIAFLLL